MEKITKGSYLVSQSGECKLEVIIVFSTPPKILGVRVLEGELTVGTSVTTMGKLFGTIMYIYKDKRPCIRAIARDEVTVKIR